MANEWPATGDTDWNVKMLTHLAVEHNTNGTHKAITATSVTTTGLVKVGAFLGLGVATELTISGGVITATRSYHLVDTQDDAGSDELDTINGGTEGDILVIEADNATRTVIAKDATGNMRLAGDFSMDSNNDRLTLLFTSNDTWVELSRSNNN